MNSISLSVVVPVFNEAENLAELYTRLQTVLRNLGVSYEILFVNDGSRDASLSVIQSLHAADPHVVYIDLSRNFGQQIAMTAGLDHCRGKAAVIMDADLQDPPELIPELYRKFESGYEVVYARRRMRSGEGPLKKITAKIFYRLLRSITRHPIPVDTGDFRIIGRKVIEVLRNMPEKQKFLRGQIAWAGFSQTFVEFDREGRKAGKTGFSFGKMLRFAIDGITSFSDLPLRIATLSGFICSGIAFILMLYTLHSRLILKDYEKGWASEMLSILFIGGIQLIAIGIIGEYISRISANVMGRPLYIVKTRSDENTNENAAEPK